MLTGWICDKIRRKWWLFLGTLTVQIASTVLFCFAPSVELLLVARILQGGSGGVVWTIALVLLTETVGSSGLGKALGYVAMARSIGLLTGPLLGGVLYERCGYYSVFIFCFVFLGIDGCFRVTFIEANRAMIWKTNGSQRKKDKTKPENEYDISLPSPTIISRNSTPLPAQSFVQRVHRRLPPTITLLGDTRLDIALWGTVLQGIMFSGFDSTIPIFVARTFGWRSLAAGLIFLTLVIPQFISPVVGWLSDRHGPRWYVASGYLLSAVPLILLRLVDHNTTGQKVLLCALLSILGVLLTLIEIPIWAEMITSAQLHAKSHPQQYKGDVVGQACGLSNVFCAVGITVGPLLAGFLHEAVGWGNMTLVLASLLLASVVPTIIWTGGFIFARKEAVTDAEHELRGL